MTPGTPAQLPIDVDVAQIAKQWGLDPALVQAVVNAEGNILRAVQCSFPTIQSREDALEVVCRSAAHALSDYVKASGLRLSFVQFWGVRWAPVGAKNDPRGLNQNWVDNVASGWRRGAVGAVPAAGSASISAAAIEDAAAGTL